MELVKNFGISPVLLGAQIVNFLVVLFILRRFLYKPIIQIMRKRQDAIKEGLKNAEDSQKKMDKIVQEEKNILRNAQTQAKQIIDETRVQSLEFSKRMQDDAKKQSEKILKDTSIQIAQETSEAEKKLTLKISDLAVKFLEKALVQAFSEQDQKEIMNKVLTKINRTTNVN